ncbi:hypothetical protein BSKO_04772 [Bryopsis sp. KO-2023]|nr:hypothetical protein BSKO_04772 [Bryopsis sp. KO-2023]
MTYLMDGVSLELQPQCDHSDMSPPIPGAERLSSDGEIAVHLDVEERLSLVVTPQRQLNTGEQERALSELNMGEGAKTVPGTSQTTSEMRMEEDRTQVVPVNPENDRANLGETEGDFGTLRTRDETLLQDSQVSGGKIKQGGKAMIETIATGTEAKESVSKDSKPNDGLGNAEREKTPDIQGSCTTETSQSSQECVVLEMHQEGDSVKVTVAIAPSGVEDGCSEAKLDDGQRVETGSTDHLDESVKVSLSTDGDSCSLSLTVNTQANSSKDPLEGLPPVHGESTGNADGDGVSVAQLKEEAEILEAEIDKERQTLQQEKQKLEKHLGVLMKVMEEHEEAESRASTPGNLQQLEAERLSLMKEIEQEKECLAAIVSTLASSMMSPRLESSVQEGARSDITNTGSPLPMDESIEQDGKLTVGGADRFRLRRKVEGGVITRSDGARINATIFHIEKGGLLHRIATVKHNGEDYCVDAGLLESLDGSIPLSKIIGEHGHLAGNAFFDFIDRGDGDIEDVNGEDVVGGILEAIAGDGKVQEMAIEGEDDCLDFDSLKRLSPEMPLDVLFAKHGHLAAMEGQGQISKVTLIGRPVIWSFYGKVKYTLVEIPENGETYVTLLRKAVVKHQGQSYLVDKDTFEYMIRGESLSQIIKKHGEVARDASPQAPAGSPPVEVRHIEDVAGNRLKYQENGNDKSGKYVAVIEHGGQRYGFDSARYRFENVVGSMPTAQLVAKYSRGPVVPATRIVSKQTIQTQDGRSEHPLSEIFSEHGDLSSKGLLVQDEGGIDSKTAFTTVSPAGSSGEREMAVVKHAKTCYVPLHIREQYLKQLTTIVSKHGIFVPNPEQEVRWMMCGDGRDICYNVTKIGRIRRRQVATVPFNRKQYELGTFKSLLRQQPVLFLIEEHGKLVQEISPHLDPTKLRYLVEECLDEDGVNRVEKVVISTGKGDHESEVEKLETLVSHMSLEETASKHGAVRAKSQKSLPLRDLTLNTTREVDKGEKTLRSSSGRDIVVIVKERVFFEEASQETEKIKRRIRLEFENNSGVEYEVRLDVLEGRLATMDIDDIARKFATLRKIQQSQEEGGDVQEDLEPVLGSQTVKGVSVKEITFWSDKSAGGLGGGEEKQVASVGFELREVDLDVFKRLAPKISVQAFLSAIDGQEEEGSFGVDLQECQGERVVFMAGETILDENHRLGPSAKKTRNENRRRKKVLIEVEDVIYEIELGSWEFAIQTMLAEIVAKGGTVRHRSEGDDHVEEVDELEEEEVASKRTVYRVEDEQGKRQETVATVPFNGKQHEIELETFESLIRQQLFLIEEHGKLVQEISPHLDPTKLLYLVEECLDEDGVNRVEKAVISTGKGDHELELEKLDTLVSHTPFEETASKHGAVRAKSQRDLTLNTTREVDKGEKTLRSPSGRDINVIVKERVFEEASQETGEIKKRMRGRRLEFENVSGVEYEVGLDVLEERLVTMEMDDIARQFGIATLRKSQHLQEEEGDVQEDVKPVLESQTVKGVSGKEIAFLAEKSAGGLGGGEDKQVASVGFKGALREVDLNVFNRLEGDDGIEDTIEKYGKLCGRTGQRTLEVAPAKHHFTAAGSSLLSAAKSATVIFKSKKKAKKAKKEKPRGNGARVCDLMDAGIAGNNPKNKDRKGKTVPDAAMNAVIAIKIKKGEKLSPPKKSAPAKEPNSLIFACKNNMDYAAASFAPSGFRKSISKRPPFVVGAKRNPGFCGKAVDDSFCWTRGASWRV